MLKLSNYIKLAFISSIILLQACSTVPTTRKQTRGVFSPSTAEAPAEEKKVDPNPDGPPHVDREVHHIPNATPKTEPLSKYGNPPTYSALGKRYYVMSHAKGYQSKGRASWYGRKFNGQRTSSGEPYDMFAMTAAHRSLPIPTYVRVKNLENNKEVIVKVNDRGPFVNDRVIDVSYAAAKKLGFHQAGTAKVHVEAIDPIAWHKEKNGIKLASKGKSKGKGQAQRKDKSKAKSENIQLAKAKVGKTAKAATKTAKAATKTHTIAAHDKANKHVYLQLGSFNKKLSAEQVAEKAQTFTQALNNVNVHVMPNKLANKQSYKVRIGPLQNKEQAQKLKKELVALGGKQAPAIVYD